MKSQFIILFCLLLLAPFTLVLAQKNLSVKRLKKKYDSSSVYKETMDRMHSNVQYPDSIVLTPWHLLDAYIHLPESISDFKSISIDIVVKDHIPDGFSYYISPFTSAFNDMLFYCGIQTSSDGKSIVTDKMQKIGRGGIFSRWFERNTGALKTSGYYASSDAEGDFISVRNKLNWDKGIYRLTLYKSGYVPGKALPETFSREDLMFSWGDYEHSWVTMKVKDLSTGDSVTIGSLAFPGKKLHFPDGFGLFLEQYQMPIDFKSIFRNIPGILDYRKVPDIKIAFKNIRINRKPVKPLTVKIYYNATHHPDQKKIKMPMPRFATGSFDSLQSIIRCETGHLFE